MFATEEYNAYVAAQDLADELYDRYEYAAGLQSLEID
jgi:hypothetical protein